MDDYRIILDPEICSGKPTIRGSRIMVSNILGMFAGGETLDGILDAYPQLNREDIGAALEYASRAVNNERVIAR